MRILIGLVIVATMVLVYQIATHETKTFDYCPHEAIARMTVSHETGIYTMNEVDILCSYHGILFATIKSDDVIFVRDDQEISIFTEGALKYLKSRQ